MSHADEILIARAEEAQRQARESVASFQRLLQKLRDQDAKRMAELRTSVSDAILECDRLLDQLRNQGVLS